MPWVYVLLYLAGVGLGRAFHFRALSARPLVGDVSLAVFLAGAALAAWGWLTFRHAKTTRVPGQVSTTLVTWGPYRFSRNPMYVGLAAAYLGEAGMLRQTGPILVLPLVLAYLNWVVIPLEDKEIA